ncbi:DUF1249 domain-containing protein [Endozoicomonas sp. OPT23]|uniref:DUF1249 domain-containing protein n=1 Tax=Endozoicomonas sp. OPT23 TaxID=2072845 RepID=UPI0018917829|nr:DUF1249 domain-containing protein [Endozoicomonas sp. OPT23]
MNKNLKPRYRTNLVKQQSLCESSFHKLRHLLPELDNQDNFQLKLHYQKHTGVVEFQVVSRAPFTLELDVSIQADWGQWLDMPSFRIRAYQDVRMAEIVSMNRERNFEALYDYPNQKMHQPDEKAQLNQLLAEWLNFCLAHGFSDQKVV